MINRRNTLEQQMIDQYQRAMYREVDEIRRARMLHEPGDDAETTRRPWLRLIRVVSLVSRPIS